MSSCGSVSLQKSRGAELEEELEEARDDEEEEATVELLEELETTEDVLEDDADDVCEEEEEVTEEVLEEEEVLQKVQARLNTRKPPR